MKDYKDTLNLPKTDFPMKANLPVREPEMLAFWQEMDLYAELRKAGIGKQKFILHDGPPYANGRIHIGHAINKTLKDIIVKSKTFNNYDAPYVPGWDCHGLPIELNVEKTIARSTEVSRPDFIKACREYAQSQVTLQKEDFIRLGVFGDWENAYLTMHPAYEAETIRSLAKIIENGHLHRGFKPVHWCIDCGSALAEAEVEYQDKTSSSLDVLFKVVNPKEMSARFGLAPLEVDVAIPIWTTTPWTLPANQAVAVNPSHRYVFLKTENLPMLVVAEELVSAFLARCKIESHQILGSCTGADLEGITLGHPFLMREVPVVCGDHVTLDAGTGAVHTAPAHGQEDYQIGQHYKLPIDNPVDGKGVYVAGTPFFAGEHIFKVEPHIIALLEEKKNLIHAAKITHSYAHCWRHKSPLIYRATPQWFISMEQNGLREQALGAIRQTRWIPEWGQMRLADMIEKRPDWCISRQRTWNTPITLFVHKHTGELHPDTLSLMERVAEHVAKGGIEAWYSLELSDLLGDDANDYERVTDTLDVWFDAGVSHAAVLRQRPELTFPADIYLEGSDQHRGWFHTSLLSSIGMSSTAPYRSVLTHGFAVDADGRKMSKSVGNVIAPEKVIQKLGADVLRWWIATTDYRGEMTVSNEILERSSEAYRRIRNTARFLLSNLDDFDAETHAVAFANMLELDQWAVDAAAGLQRDIIEAYEGYQFHTVTQRIHHFCSIDLGGFYLDILKDRLYTTAPDSHPRRSAQSAMYHILQALVRWIAPILSFTAEEIWQHMQKQTKPSVFLTTWYADLQEIDATKRKEWQVIMDVRERVNQELERQRNAGTIGSGLAAEVALYCDESLRTLLASLGEELRFIFITSEAQVFPLDAYTGDSSDETLKIIVNGSTHEKCGRCWHRRPDVGQHPDHPTLCHRCVENISGAGEKRVFA